MQGENEGRPLWINFIEIIDFKRISTFRARIDENKKLIPIAGPCRSGKSCVLEALMFTFGGGKLKKRPRPSVPIREGAEEARIRVHVTDGVDPFWAETRITPTGQPGEYNYDCEIRFDDGKRITTTAATWLRGLIDAGLFTDPTQFVHMEPSDLRREVLQLAENLNLDLDTHAAERDKLVKAESAAKDEIKRLMVDLGKLTAPAEGIPDAEQSILILNAQLEALQTTKRERATCAQDLVAAKEAIKTLDKEVADIELALDKKRRELIEKQGAFKVAQSSYAAFPTDLDDKIAATSQAIGQLESVNAAVRAKNNYQEKQRALNEAVTLLPTCSSAVVAHDRKRDEAIAAATFPVEGMSVVDGIGVVVNGKPSDLWSGAETALYCAKMAMAKKPRLRSLFIWHGNDLDSDMLHALSDFAVAENCQVFVHWVSKVKPTEFTDVIFLKEGMYTDGREPDLFGSGQDN